MFDYIRDPKEIYRRSFEVLRAEADLSGMADGVDTLVERLIHACGMPDIIDDFAYGGNPAVAGYAALAAGAHHNLLATMILFELFPYVHEFAFKNIINIV